MGVEFKWSMRASVPSQREAARFRAVRSFRTGARADGPAESRAECALRVGELLRAGELRIAAHRELMFGVDLEVGEWSARCALIAAELSLEEQRGADALIVLLNVSSSKEPARIAERAAVLMGDAFVVMGEASTAVMLWRRVAEDGVSTSERFSAFERWGHGLLLLGDLEGAAGVLSRSRDCLEKISLEMTTTGRALNKKLAESSLARSLHHAVIARYEESQ